MKNKSIVRTFQVIRGALGYQQLVTLVFALSLAYFNGKEFLDEGGVSYVGAFADLVTVTTKFVGARPSQSGPTWLGADILYTRISVGGRGAGLAEALQFRPRRGRRRLKPNALQGRSQTSLCS